MAPAEALLRTEAGLRLTVNALAEACGMTSSKFIRQFTKQYGMTPGDYIQDKRVNGARSLIGKGMSISEAAFAMGFADQAHLQRSFKQYHAMTPGRYQPHSLNSSAFPSAATRRSNTIFTRGGTGETLER